MEALGLRSSTASCSPSMISRELWRGEAPESRYKELTEVTRPAIAVCQAKRCPCLALLVSSCITEVCLKHVGANSFAKGQYIRCIFIDPNSAFANKFAPTEIAGVFC